MALEYAKLSEFQIAGALGAGTTAKVYEAVHTSTGRQVAIKMLEPSQAGSEMRERFAREALLLSGMNSRHVGKILSFGFERGQPFLVLERLTGETLDAKLRRDGPVPMHLATKWLEQLFIGVRDCHDAKIIHRDIKPSNVFLNRENGAEVVKLIDFGVARLREIAGSETGLTSTSHLIGSMGYMAPEQFANAKSVGFTADIYALGVVIFRTLTGRLPFVSRSLEAVIRMKSEQLAPTISSMPGMPKNQLLDWFVKKTMAREPLQRFQSAREMLEHWATVMTTLDEDAATEVSIGIADLVESLAAAPLNRGMRNVAADAHAPRPIVPRPGPTQLSPVSAPRSAKPPSSDPTLEDLPPTHRSMVHEEDQPTRADPELAEIVRRELERERQRKR